MAASFIRTLASALLLTGLVLPYAETPSNVCVTLPQMLQRYLFVSEHRQLAPLLLLVGTLQVLLIAIPTQRWAVAASLIVCSFWGFLMLAIPAGMAHVRPTAGYWVNQGLMLVELLAMGRIIFERQ